MKEKKCWQFAVCSLQSVLLLILLIVGCTNKKEWKETATGLRYIIFDDMEGAVAHVADGLQLHLVYKNSADSVLFDSQTLGNAFTMELTEPPFKGSLEEGFALLSEGDSAAFEVVADSVYKNVFHQAMPKMMPAGERLRIDVRVIKILTPSEYKTFMHQQAGGVMIDENTLIKKYMTDNQISAVPDSNGLYFISFVDGTGKQPMRGDHVEVSYLVRSLNGELFDSSDKAYKTIVGDTSMIKGWNLGIMKMKVGGKARFIVPSKIGYGNKANGKIPPNTPLVFDVDLIRINN